MSMERSAKLVNSVINRLSQFGKITSRSMFGGYGLCINKAMFGLVSNNEFYLRAGENSDVISLFQEHNMQQYFYLNRGIPIAMHYYRVNSDVWNNEALLSELAKIALCYTESDKKVKEGVKKERLKELPNITLSIERILWRVGIPNQESLFQLGAINAFVKMQSFYKNLSTDILFALAGAIEGCHAAILTDKFKEQLLNTFYQYPRLAAQGST